MAAVCGNRLDEEWPDCGFFHQCNPCRCAAETRAALSSGRLDPLRNFLESLERLDNLRRGSQGGQGAPLPAP